MRAIVLIVATLLAACSDKPPVERQPTDNPQISLDLLFEVDGCRVYRFADGNNVYFATCAGKVQSSHEEICGKGCVRRVPDTSITVRQK